MKIDILKWFGAAFGSILLLAGCEYSGPKAIWNPDADLGPTTQITQVDPADSAKVGVGTIRIIGQNFGLSNDKTEVYFDNVKGVLKQVSPGEIMVYRPPLSGDDITIKVVVNGNYVVAKSPHYKIPNVYRTYGNIIPKGIVAMVDVTKNDIMYAIVRKDIYKITPDESNYPIGKQGSKLKGTMSDMKVGPGGYLYIQRKDNRLVYRLDLSIEDPDNNVPVEFGSFARNASYIDFDQYGNLYGVYKLGVSVLKDSNSALVGDFQGIVATGIRVFDNHVYVSDIENNIWRAQILDANGNLGNKEMVLDWATSGDYAESTLLSFDFAADGTIYLGTDNADPVLIQYPDGTLEPLYKGIMLDQASQVIWSNHGDLFVNRTGEPERADIFLVRLGKEGAPHYGRIL